MATDTPVILGSQTPTHLLVPQYDYSDADMALEIAAAVGLELDPWQCDFLINALGRRYVPNPAQVAAGIRKPDTVSRWAATEVGLELSRQNGKSVGFEVRTLAGLFVFREQLIVYTAHKGETAMEAFRRVDDLISSDPELKAEVKQVRTGNGKEYIRLHSGQTVKFRTRTAGGGRGLAGDCVLLDEAQDLVDAHIAALYPTMAARSITGDPQMWYAGSAGTRKSVILGRLVRRMLHELGILKNGGDPEDAALMMARWAADLDVDDPSAVETWAKTNPALGRRISIEYVAGEYRALGAATNPGPFSQERLGVGDYPREEGEDWVIPRRRWEAGEDRDSKALDPVVFAIEVAWNRQSTSIGVAGQRADGGRHLEVVAHEIGTTWAVQECKRLKERWKPLGFVIDPGSPANSLIAPLRDAGIDVTLLKAQDITKAWGSFYDGFMADPPNYHHTGGILLTANMAEAETRNVAGALTWKRAVASEVAGLLAVTWAAHALDMPELVQQKPPPPPPKRAGSGGRRARADDISSIGF